MKNKRLQEIEGTFHGIKFSINPTPLNIDEVQEEIGDMLTKWYEENEPDVLEESDLLSQDTGDMSREELQELADLLNSLNAWKKDVDFRAKYIKAMATAAMDFDKEPDEELWKRDDLAWSTVKEAWDFFCGRRAIPQSGLQYK